MGMFDGRNEDWRMNGLEPDLMTRFEKEAPSFVIRLWRENRDEAKDAAVWRGWIDHVQSGRRRHFQKMGAIQEIIAGYISDNASLDSVFEPIQGNNK